MWPSGLAVGPGSKPCAGDHALDEFAVWQVDRDARVAVFKAGRAAAGAAEGEGVEAGVGAGGGRGEGFCGKGVVSRDADVFGCPAFLAAGGDVGVDPFVRGVAGSWDAAVVDAVEDASVAFGSAGSSASG